jgi:hypothetical protein
MRGGFLFAGAGGSIYTALTGWIDLAPAIKTAWDAGPDNDPGSYHPDNDGDWTLTHTAGSPGTLTLAGTTGASSRDGWDEWARFDVGSFATLMGVDGATLGGDDTVVLMEAALASLGTPGTARPMMVAAVAVGATNPVNAPEGAVAGVVVTSGSQVSGVRGASATSSSTTSGYAPNGFAFRERVQRNIGSSNWVLIESLAENSGAPVYYLSEASQINNRAITSASHLWFGAGQFSTTAAAFTGLQASFRARVLRRSQVPWDPDFGL